MHNKELEMVKIKISAIAFAIRLAEKIPKILFTRKKQSEGEHKEQKNGIANYSMCGILGRVHVCAVTTVRSG